jgi:uncharacterized protein (DUF849 family)
MHQREIDNLIDTLQDIAKEACIRDESHNYMANFWTNFYLYTGITNTIIAALASASSFSEITDNNNKVAGLLTAVVAVISAVITYLNPAEKATKHKEAKDKFSCVYYDARDLADEMKTTDTEEELEKLKEQKKAIAKKLVDAQKDSPQVAHWVRKIARDRAKDRG